MLKGAAVKGCGVGMLLYGMVLMGWEPPTPFMLAALKGARKRLLFHTPLDDCNLMWALAVWR